MVEFLCLGFSHPLLYPSIYIFFPGCYDLALWGQILWGQILWGQSYPRATINEDEMTL